MKHAKAALAVLLCPLAGATVWTVDTMVRSVSLARRLNESSLIDGATQDSAGFLWVVGIAWIYGLLLTVLVGLPLGFFVDFLLRRANAKGLAAYAVAGAGSAFAISLVIPGGVEFLLPMTVTGLLMGVSYWKLYRHPHLRTGELS